MCILHLHQVSFNAQSYVELFNFPIADVDRTVYITLLVEYLRYLHFVVEQWSRMNGMQEILVECGAFFLLLNELHTASTTPVSISTS